ncbi:MAG: malate synthase A [Elusimicrobiota bacterium]|nr:malate synthase A [Elusimicrobiota bacterium]
MRAPEAAAAGTALSAVAGVAVRGPVSPAHASILTPEALAFLAGLQRAFDGRRRELLSLRVERQARLDAGALPRLDPATADLRRDAWSVAKAPKDLLDRRVEITGPPERKMIINALNSGAKVFMADFEDSHSPAWGPTLDGQVNLRDAVRRTITFASPEGKSYALKPETAVLFCRPRGWHLEEKHLLVDGAVMSASLFDYGLYFFHNARELVARGSGPYFYLPKMESALEARLWNDAFLHAQKALGLPVGTIRATVLIETLPAAFQMEEILWELREHSAGLNCGRWDYIFSFIKRLGGRKEFLLGDRGGLGMTQPFLRAYSRRLIETCHRRGAHAMGGMAAQIPIKGDDAANEAALAKVRADKEREAGDGHDGTWVAHPGLVPLAAEVFDRLMPGPNQLDKVPSPAPADAELVAVPSVPLTEEGLRVNLAVGLQYLAAWLSGIGCVPIRNLMEDAATAEISRAQVWQWVRHGAVAPERFKTLLKEETERARSKPETRFEPAKLDLAARLFEEMILSPRCVEFLTIPAYQNLD